MTPALKRPKPEDADIDPLAGPPPTAMDDEQEEALIAVMDHRAREMEHIKKKIFYFQAQLTEAESRFRDSETQLAHLRFRRRQPPPDPPAAATATKPKLVVPAPAAPKVSTFARSEKPPASLVAVVAGAESPATVRISPGTYIASQHKRKLRSLVLSPADDHLFATAALDGVVNLWRLVPAAAGTGALLVSSADCVSPRQRRWPEDVAWHPKGGSLFCAYTADGGDSQVSVLSLKDGKVSFLEERPHVKGIINCIAFMPWSEDGCFGTGGSDHSVVLWRGGDESGGLWKHKVLHKNLHSSTVMGVAGMQMQRMVMSAGSDRKIIGFDVEEERASYRIMTDSKCTNVLPNPKDFNLVMVQSRAPGRQLRLFDIRMKPTEVHAFGWRQESSESQSALISQTWSPDGLYISSGSADPAIHIFDIRCKTGSPSQSVNAHQKRVFRAAWHRSRPLLVSISSDLQIGLHQISAA